MPAACTARMIQIKSGGDTIPGYLARPSQPGSYPGIVVIHEAFGLVDHIRDLARRFANIGYNAVAPDLYSRGRARPTRTTSTRVFPVMFGQSDAEAVQDLEAAAAHLRGLSGATGKDRRHRLLLGRPAHAAVRLQQRQGRCGGRLLGRLYPPRHPRCRDHAVAADADPRSGRPAALPAVRRVRRGGPEPDGGASEELKKRGARAGKDVTTKIYRDAGHAFLADYRPSYREGPAAELWTRCRRVLRQASEIGPGEQPTDQIE